MPARITRYLDDASPVTTQTQYHATLDKPVRVRIKGTTPLRCSNSIGLT